MFDVIDDCELIWTALHSCCNRQNISQAFCDMNVTFTVYMGNEGPQSPVLELMLTVSEGEGGSRSSPFVLQPPTLDEVIISVLLQG